MSRRRASRTAGTGRRPRRRRAWYVVHSYSGYENKVKKNLEQRIETMGMQDKIFRVVVPTEEEVEIRDGQRRTSRRRVFPGYILVHMILDDESWYVVRNTPGVTGFVGSGTKPTPLSKEEVDKILQRMEAEQPRIKVSFRVGETVRIIEGPFADFMARGGRVVSRSRQGARAGLVLWARDAGRDGLFAGREDLDLPATRSARRVRAWLEKR